MRKGKRIGILTLPIGMNVGGTLQAFALNTVLYDMGYEVETINNKLNDAKVSMLMRAYRGFTEFFQRKFIKDHIILGKQKMYTHQDFCKIKDYYDAIIVGSDQVWRKGCTDECLYEYFLEFVGLNCHKIAYAASFGISYWEYDEDERRRMRELVKSFDAISVREITGVELCDKYLSRKSVHVLDPTLLLSKDTYVSLCKKRLGKKKLFAYILDESEDKKKIVADCSKVLGLDICLYKERKKIKNLFLLKDLNLTHYMFPSVREWLTRFVEADFVVTDSFHGIVFSIILNKQFIAIANNDRGLARVESLLGKFSLCDRMVKCYSDYSGRIWKTIDFISVNENLQSEREKSFDFLKNALKCLYK